MGKKGAGYAPAYASNSSQPANSRWNPDRILTAREKQQGHVPPSQVDSWRSYRNDATNLVQTANDTDSWNMPGNQYLNRPSPYLNGRQQTDSYEQYVGFQQVPWIPATLPSQLAGGQQLNPYAEEFQPNSPTSLASPLPGSIEPYEALRVPNGMEKQNVQPNSSNPSSGRSRRKRYALRSQGLLGASTSLQDTPLPSIEQQSRQSSSIPTLIKPHPVHKAPKRSTTKDIVRPPTPLPVPVTTEAYLAQASQPPLKLIEPQHLLVVLDLNGTLLKRTDRSFHFQLRPGVTNFLEYLFANHTVMIYSSARPENVTRMVTKLFTDLQRQSLAAVWARDRLDLTAAQYNSKVQVYKKLEKIWADPDIQKTAQHERQWSQENTVLIDDSHLKAAAQPHNLLQVEEFMYDPPSGHGHGKGKGRKEALKAWTSQQEKIVDGLQTKLEELKWTKDVSRLIRQWQGEAGQDAKKSASPIVDETDEQVQLPTPISLQSDSTDDDQSDGGVDYRDAEIDELAKKVGDQLTVPEHSGRVSPIDESVFRDLLGFTQSSSTPT